MKLLLAIMVVLAAMMTAILIAFCSIPGLIADKRGHPRAGAIRLCGYACPLTLGVSWIVGAIWALRGPRHPAR